jgi:hypothetical protein
MMPMAARDLIVQVIRSHYNPKTRSFTVTHHGWSVEYNTKDFYHWLWQNFRAACSEIDLQEKDMRILTKLARGK